ncbi:MAG: hypothetical protein DME19_04495 [Verrucomicrobia bacterium]|nr:MAG: hypothetical protein DME19_04495 [Verrucomicrobiota bacterium]
MIVTRPAILSGSAREFFNRPHTINGAGTFEFFGHTCKLLVDRRLDNNDMKLSKVKTIKSEAVALKTILEPAARDTKIYLSSDWESLEAGAPWFEPLIEAIKRSTAFFTIIPDRASSPGSSFRNLWINFEVGLAIGSGKKPKVFVFGEVNWSLLEYPLKGIHLIDTGDTNRWVKELTEAGFNIAKEVEERLAALFRQASQASSLPRVTV